MTAVQTSFSLGAVRVLAADDDPTVRALVSSTLAPEVARLVEAEDGEDALRRLAEEPFDLVISDLDMPRMNGFGLIEAVRAQDETRHLPIIVVTGRDDVIAIERAFALGATSFVAKPVNWTVFRHQVAYVMRMATVERQTREARERAEELKRLKDDSLAVIDHEIRTALNSVHGFAEVLRAEAFGPLGDPRYAGYGEGIIASSERLLSTYAAILDSSRILSDEAPFSEGFASVPEIVAGAVEALPAELDRARIRVAYGAGGEAARLFCDRGLLARALANVLDNALTFSGDKPVTLAARLTPRGQLRFEVTDEGEGIEPGLIEAVTKPFNLHGRYTTRPGRNPLGLGLAVAQAVLRRHGGRLAIASERGRGTEIFLTLPPVRVRTEASSSPPPAEAKPGRDDTSNLARIA